MSLNETNDIEDLSERIFASYRSYDFGEKSRKSLYVFTLLKPENDQRYLQLLNCMMCKAGIDCQFVCHGFRSSVALPGSFFVESDDCDYSDNNKWKNFCLFRNNPSYLLIKDLESALVSFDFIVEKVVKNTLGCIFSTENDAFYLCV